MTDTEQIPIGTDAKDLWVSNAPIDVEIIYGKPPKRWLFQFREPKWKETKGWIKEMSRRSINMRTGIGTEDTDHGKLIGRMYTELVVSAPDNFQLDEMPPAFIAKLMGAIPGLEDAMSIKNTDDDEIKN